MPRDKQLNLRLTDKELKKLHAYAAAEGISASEVLRDAIKALPDLAAPGRGEGGDSAD